MMTFSRGDFVVFSDGISKPQYGASRLWVGVAMGVAMVQIDGTRGKQKCKPRNVFGVFKHIEAANDCINKIDALWQTHNHQIRALKAQIDTAIKVQVEDCQDRLIG